jgi:hypothetical protein
MMHPFAVGINPTATDMISQQLSSIASKLLLHLDIVQELILDRWIEELST